MKQIIGGGPKKVLYTLNTVRRIGLKKSSKALRTKNTCKACGLGMGGQQGGMTNEMGEFPSVCNKSIQAQSTDIQAPIPNEVFEHSIEELQELSAHELEHMGRLNTPIFKTAEDNKFRPVTWDWAMKYAADKFDKAEADRSFFYTSGRSSNEAGFLLQLIARLYGTNNVTNCSYYCHQATGVGLGSTIGSGTATVELADLSGCDLVFIIGANPSSNHPRLIHQLKNCRERGGDVVIINPAKEPGLVKFAVPKSPKSMLSGGSDIASLYIQPRIGSDIALFKGIAKALIENNQYDDAFIQQHCQDFEEFAKDIAATSWQTIIEVSGISREQIDELSELYSKSKNTVFAWGMGMTHHQFGSENVEYIANLALLRGMIGGRYRGLLPLRGHSNVQGIGTIGVKPVLAEDVLKKIEQHFDVELPKTKGMDTLQSIKAASNGEIDCALIMGGNLYSATPDSTWAAEALDKIPFKLFLTTTLNQGHIHGVDSGDVMILPVAARDEEDESTTQESMFNFVRLSEGGIQRLDNVRAESVILADLASQLFDKQSEQKSIDFQQFKKHDNIRKAIADIVPGMELLEDINETKQEFSIPKRVLHEPVFETDSKRAAFITRPIPNANPFTEEFPLLLASIRSEGQFNSIIYEETDSYRHNAKRDAILMCQEDMDALGVSSGYRVQAVSQHGELDNLYVQAFDLPKGSVLAYYPEANVLTGTTCDPRSKTPNFKSVPIKLIPN